MQMVSVKIEVGYLKKLREISKALFLKAHPEYKKFRISDRFILEETIDYYNKPTLGGLIK